MRHHRRRRAFSLLELCLALFILGLAVLPMLTSFSQATRGVAQTSEYSQALFLTQMALEDEQARFEVNPLMLLEDEAAMHVPAAPVVDGAAPYFQVIEDAVEPYGRMIPGSDPAIEAERVSLYKQLVPFKIATNVDFRVHPQLPQVPSLLAEVQVEMTWSGIDGKMRYFTLPMLIARPRPGAGPSAVELDITSYEDVIRRQFYPEEPEGRTLKQVADARGAELRTVQDLGRVVLFEMALESEFKVYDAEIDEARAYGARAGADAEDRAEAAIWEGKIHERKASLALHVPLQVKGPLDRLAQGDFHARLGSPAPRAERFAPQLWRFGHLPRAMLAAGREAVTTFARAAQGSEASALSSRRLLAVQYRILEMGHLLTLSGLDLKPLLQDLVSQLITQQDGKNPYVVSYARGYLSLLREPDRLRDVFSSWTERLEGLRSIPATIDGLLRTTLSHQPSIGPIEIYPGALGIGSPETGPGPVADSKPPSTPGAGP